MGADGTPRLKRLCLPSVLPPFRQAEEWVNHDGHSTCEGGNADETAETTGEDRRFEDARVPGTLTAERSASTLAPRSGFVQHVIMLLTLHLPERAVNRGAPADLDTTALALHSTIDANMVHGCLSSLRP